jgi:hypothetical protein
MPSAISMEAGLEPKFELYLCLGLQPEIGGTFDTKMSCYKHALVITITINLQITFFTLFVIPLVFKSPLH